jgi:hypothetical protein
MVQVAESLPSKYKTPSSNPSTAKKEAMVNVSICHPILTFLSAITSLPLSLALLSRTPSKDRNFTLSSVSRESSEEGNVNFSLYSLPSLDQILRLPLTSSCSHPPSAYSPLADLCLQLQMHEIRWSPDSFAT